MIRTIASVLAALSLVSCSAPSSSPVSTEPPRELPTSADEVIESLDVLDDILSSLEEPDITMAWSDLDRDLRSLVDEAVHHPDGSHFDGIRDRVEGFRSRFQEREEISATAAHWNQLVAGLEDLRTHLDTQRPS